VENSRVEKAKENDKDGWMENKEYSKSSCDEQRLL